MSIRGAKHRWSSSAHFVGGFAFGGTIGLGTVLYALAIGPTTQFWMKQLSGLHLRSATQRLPIELGLKRPSDALLLRDSPGLSRATT